ncbi:MAG: hypothetical protein QOD50_1719 [Actinomycetota bacterium]|jgi:hypothetical protein|nr:hypothetical protein [Actinomycetota bacterium]
MCCATPVVTCGFTAMIGRLVRTNRRETTYRHSMRQRARPAEDASDVLRRRALDDLDELIDAAGEARKNLRSYQTVLERNRKHLAAGGRASDMAIRFDVPAVRASLSDRLKLIEQKRHASRVSLWRLQRFEGTTLAEIARMWGLSRQLVSRELQPEDAQQGRYKGAR